MFRIAAAILEELILVPRFFCYVRDWERANSIIDFLAVGLKMKCRTRDVENA